MGSNFSSQAEASGSDVNVGSHLKSAQDVKEYPQFPPGTTSLLRRCLTKSVWEKYKNVKDKHGFSFKEAIFSGCKNVDSGIGVYAGSHESYYTFSDLFDRIIEVYHGHKKNDKHVSNMDASQLDAPDLPADEAAMI
jgi:arginine kinase